MGQLMPDNIHRNCKAVEKPFFLGQVFIPVAIHHLFTVPEGIVIAQQVVHCRDQLHAVAVNGIAAENIAVQVIG